MLSIALVIFYSYLYTLMLVNKFGGDVRFVRLGVSGSVMAISCGCTIIMSIAIIFCALCKNGCRSSCVVSCSFGTVLELIARGK